MLWNKPISGNYHCNFLGSGAGSSAYSAKLLSGAGTDRRLGSTFRVPSWPQMQTNLMVRLLPHEFACKELRWHGPPSASRTCTRRSSAFIEVKRGTLILFRRPRDALIEARRRRVRRAKQQLLLNHNPPTRELVRMRHPLRKRSAISVPAACARGRPCCDRT
jgi:hypothetical protein